MSDEGPLRRGKSPTKHRLPFSAYYWRADVRMSVFTRSQFQFRPGQWHAKVLFPWDITARTTTPMGVPQQHWHPDALRTKCPSEWHALSSNRTKKIFFAVNVIFLGLMLVLLVESENFDNSSGDCQINTFLPRVYQRIHHAPSTQICD